MLLYRQTLLLLFLFQARAFQFGALGLVHILPFP